MLRKKVYDDIRVTSGDEPCPHVRVGGLAHKVVRFENRSGIPEKGKAYCPRCWEREVATAN